MPIGTNLPVASIGELGDAIHAERVRLAGELYALRTRVERDPNFTGNAAEAYDRYIAQWRAGQEQMLAGLDGASSLLAKFHSVLEELGIDVSRGFNV